MMPGFLSLLLVSVLVAGVTAGRAGAETMVLRPDRDNTLFEDASGNLSNGAGRFLFVGLTQAFGVRRALLHFDVAGALPEGSVIHSVTLTVGVNRSQPASIPVRIHRVTADWGAGASDASDPEGQGGIAATGDATWLHRFFPDQLWSTVGGDFDPTASASRSIMGNADYPWSSTPALAADVQGWLDDPASNFGWILIGQETGGRNAKRMLSQDSGSGRRPQLTIEFTPGCVFGSVNATGIGGRADVLFVNGEVGDPVNRRVLVPLGTTFDVELRAAPAGPVASIDYVIWGWIGDARSPLDLLLSGDDLGCTVNPTPLDPMAQPQPVLCVHSVGADPGQCGPASIRNSPATAPFLVGRGGFNRAKVLTIQGVTGDSSSPSATGLSITNSIIIDAQ
jgi:hypothetical protein